jgi:hypothetical protein
VIEVLTATSVPDVLFGKDGAETNHSVSECVKAVRSLVRTWSERPLRKRFTAALYKLPPVNLRKALSRFGSQRRSAIVPPDSIVSDAIKMLRQTTGVVDLSTLKEQVQLHWVGSNKIVPLAHLREVRHRLQKYRQKRGREASRNVRKEKRAVRREKKRENRANAKARRLLRRALAVEESQVADALFVERRRWLKGLDPRIQNFDRNRVKGPGHPGAHYWSERNPALAARVQDLLLETQPMVIDDDILRKTEDLCRAVEAASKRKLRYPRTVSKHTVLQRRGAVRRKTPGRKASEAGASSSVATGPSAVASPLTQPSKEAIMWSRFRQQ